MSYFRKISLIVCAVMMVCFAANFTLTENQSNGLYPIDADSIGIPLMLTLADSLIMLVLMLSAIGITALGKSKSRARKIWVLFIIAGLYSGALYVAGEAALSWMIPHHYTICAAYSLLLAVIGISFITDLRALTYRIPVNTDDTAGRFKR